MTDDEADLKLLSLASDKGKFAIEIGYPMGEDLLAAFERGIDNEWFTLVDVSEVIAVPGRLMRVFRLTSLGWQHRRWLESTGQSTEQNNGPPE